MEDTIVFWRLCNVGVGCIALVLALHMTFHIWAKADPVNRLLGMAFIALLVTASLTSLFNALGIPLAAPVITTVGLTWSIVASLAALHEIRNATPEEEDVP